MAPGQKVDVVKKRLTRFLKTTFPAAQVQSQQDIKNQATQSVNQLLYLIYVLLAMSVLVSLFGIINTLILSIYERTREIGMLRAIGTTRSQIRWTVTWESVITAIIGAVLGLVLGIVLAVLVTSGLKSQGIEYAIPVGSLLIWVVFAIVFGVAASISRRAGGTAGRAAGDRLRIEPAPRGVSRHRKRAVTHDRVTTFRRCRGDAALCLLDLRDLLDGRGLLLAW